MAPDSDLLLRMEQLINAGSPAAALEHWQTKGRPETHLTLFLAGVAEQKQGNHLMARDLLQRSCELDAEFPPTLRHMAAVCFMLGDYPAAIAWVERYEEHRPYDHEALGWKIFALKELNRLADAEKALDEYAEAFPYASTTKECALLLAEARLYPMMVLMMAGRLGKAAWPHQFIGHAAVAAWVNMHHVTLASVTMEKLAFPGMRPEEDATYAVMYGDLLGLQNRSVEMVSWYERARAMGFNEEHSWLNEALARFSIGDFANGAVAYRKRPAMYKRLYLDGIAEWQGQPLQGKTLLVHSEQGCGDVIQYIRYLPDMLQLDGTVIFNTYPDIMSLLKADGATARSDDLDETRLIEQIDYQICMMDVPGFLRPNGIADFPTQTPYLYPNPDKAAAWKDKLAGYPGLKIGLVWAGNPEHTNDHNRSASLMELAPLRELEGVSWFALQKGAGAPETAFPPSGFELHDLGSEIKDFSDTAAILANLDLLISIDTSVAHLAGACNLPCWMLLPAIGEDWRWRTQGEVPAWYPSMRLYRRAADEDWEGLLRRQILPKLIELGAHHRPPPEHLYEVVSVDMRDALAKREFGKLRDHVTTALEQTPGHPELNRLLSLAAQELGNKEQALSSLREALRIQPRHQEANRRMVALLDGADFREALKHLQTAMRLKLHDRATWFQAAVFFLVRGAPLITEQLTEFLLQEKDEPETRALLALSQLHQGEREAAQRTVAPLKDAPIDAANTLYNLIAVADLLPERPLAERLLKRYCEMVPQDASLPGLLYLSWGDYRLGWRYYDRNEWPEPAETPLDVPLWTEDQDLGGKRLLVYQDQGYGDVLQFACLIQSLASTCMLTLSVFPEVAELLAPQAMMRDITIITHADIAAQKHDFDYRVGFMHLVARLAPDLEHPPATYPYLKIGTERLPQWQQHCAEDTGFKVGIVWAGNRQHKNDYYRSTSLGDWLPLAHIQGVSYYNLQRDASSNQALEYTQLGLHDHNIVADCHRMLDTAASVELLDLVISIDSAVAHLSAALGKETWILLPYIGTDFRWQRERTDCPWYPSARLFRQQAGESWKDVLARVSAALQERIGNTV